MIFSCTACHQNLEADGVLLSPTVTCPICHNLIVVPKALAESALAPRLGSSLAPSSDYTLYTQVPSPLARRSDLLKVLLILLIAALIGLGYLYEHRPQSAADACQSLIEDTREWYTPSASSRPTTPSAAQAAPIPAAKTATPVITTQTSAPVPASPPPAAVVPAVPAPPPPDSLQWLASKAQISVVTVTLLTDTRFPIIYHGNAAGFGIVPSGSAVDLVNLDEKTDQVTIAYPAYGNSTATVPIRSTDVAARALIDMKKAADSAKVEAAKPIASASAPLPLIVAPAPTDIASAPSTHETPAAQIAATDSLPNPNEKSGSSGPFVHPGLLLTEADFARIKAKVDAQAEPWESGWQRLLKNPHSQLTWTPHPMAIVYRGYDHVHHENYNSLFNDAAAAYALALRWKISGDPTYAKKGIEILNAWSSTLTSVEGTSDRYLASGIYGYEMANAGEILRTSPDWKADDFQAFQNMMLTVFATMNQDFLTRHNGAAIDHYWANWDLANMASLLSIGVLADRRDLYDQAVEYFKHGDGNGSIKNAVPFLFPEENLGQWQESGRDQGHTLMGIAVMGTFCQMAWNQGDDLFSYDDNRFLKAAEYVAKYNLGNDVPYTPYDNKSVPHPYSLATISNVGRGGDRPAWELVYNHYVVMKGLAAPYVTQYAAKERPEGGGGDYGPNSGGFDQLGYGTLAFTVTPAEAAGSSSAPAADGTSRASAATP